MTWEFLYQRSSETTSDLHTLTVSIAESLNPMHMLRALLSPDRQDFERVGVKLAPIVCEVNYVDSLLSLELVQLVARWNKTLRKPVSFIGMGDFIYKYQEMIVKTARYSLEYLIPSVYLFAVYVWMVSQYSNGVSTQFISSALMLTMLFLFVIKTSDRFAGFMSGQINKRIERMNRFPIFELTDGDQNRMTDAFAKMKSSSIRFWVEITFTFLIDLASAIVIFFIFRSLGLPN